MKKKNKLSFGLVVIIAALAIWISSNQWFGKDSSITGADYDFAIEDTASITRIEIADRTPDTAILTRINGQWLVNGEHPVRKDAIEVLLETMYRVELKNFPPTEAHNSILARMATHGKEVKIYAGDKLLKHFFVGTETPDQLGTYMMKKDGHLPYAIYIPGFNGYLSSRFFTREDLWRNRVIFGVDNLDIREVKMKYPRTPEAGFTVKQNDNGDLSVFDYAGVPIKVFDAQYVRYFLGSFRTLQYEGAIIPDDKVWGKQDSLRAQMPAFEITLTDKNDATQNLVAYFVPPKPDTFDHEGNPLLHDPNRFYAYLSGNRFVLIQAYAFDNVIKTIDYFKRQAPEGEITP